MKINLGRQVDIEAVEQVGIDLFILAGNHEERVFTAYDRLNANGRIGKAVMFCYDEFICQKQYDNIEKIIIKDTKSIYDILRNEIDAIKKDEMTIFIDYSCMTKFWYYSITLYLSNVNNNIEKLTSYFSYTPSEYSEPQLPRPNTEIAPLPGKYIVPTDKPKALIVCLGYEQNKAEGIIDHLDPKRYFIFYTDPAFDQRFVTALKDNNNQILSSTTRDNIIAYPFGDLLYLERKLTELYHLLKRDYSVIIAPIGPKPFSFVSMLLTVQYPDIEIWRVGSGSDINQYKRQPLSDNHFIVCIVEWKQKHLY